MDLQETAVNTQHEKKLDASKTLQTGQTQKKKVVSGEEVAQQKDAHDARQYKGRKV